jgi:hypothetical protein
MTYEEHPAAMYRRGAPRDASKCRGKSRACPQVTSTALATSERVPGYSPDLVAIRRDCLDPPRPMR